LAWREEEGPEDQERDELDGEQPRDLASELDAPGSLLGRGTQCLIN